MLSECYDWLIFLATLAQFWLPSGQKMAENYFPTIIWKHIIQSPSDFMFALIGRVFRIDLLFSDIGLILGLLLAINLLKMTRFFYQYLFSEMINFFGRVALFSHLCWPSLYFRSLWLDIRWWHACLMPCYCVDHFLSFRKLFKRRDGRCICQGIIST